MSVKPNPLARPHLLRERAVHSRNGTTTTLGFAGAIEQNNKTLAIAEHDGGYSFGQLVGPDEIEFTYLQDGSPYSAAIDSFRRVSSG